MKKIFATAALVLLSVTFISWGDKGHSAIGLIAENHLTPKTKAAIKQLLGRDDLADVANYADEIKGSPQMKYTKPWHYLDMSPGLTFVQFAEEVRKMNDDPKGNAYTAILNCERVLTNATKSRTDKAFALKMLVHIIGDAHQPFHVGNPADQGGNKISIKFVNESGELHALWDYMLIDHEKLDYKQMAVKYDNATPVQIKQWQADPLIKWFYESYLISTELYKEVAENPNLNEDYYTDHIELVHQRILKGGIRLAAVLNNTFDLGGPDNQ